MLSRDYRASTPHSTTVADGARFAADYGVNLLSIALACSGARRVGLLRLARMQLAVASLRIESLEFAERSAAR